jgi:hypothetical protein
MAELHPGLVPGASVRAGRCSGMERHMTSSTGSISHSHSHSTS